MKAKLVFFIMWGIIFLSIQLAYCESISLYVYGIRNDALVLLKFQSPGSEWIQLVMQEDSYKQGNITMKIYKPAITPDKWGEWKIGFFSDLASAFAESVYGTTYEPATSFVMNYRFIRYLRDQVKSGYSAMVKLSGLSLSIFDVNKMLKSQPDDDSVKRLGAFGYGIKDATIAELFKKAKEDDAYLVIEPSFKHAFSTDINGYITRAYRPINWQPYLYTGVPVLVAVIGLAVFVIYMIARIRKVEEDRKLLERDTANVRREMQAKNEALAEQHKNELAQQDNRWLKTTMNVLDSIDRLLSERIKTAEANLPIYRVQRLLESIGTKVGGNWLEASTRRLSEILQEKPAVPDSDAHLTTPETVDEFKKINWLDQFSPMLNRLINTVESMKSLDADSRRMLETMGREIIHIVVDAVDGEKSIHGSEDPSVEADLKELMNLTSVREMHVTPGITYNPEFHELVISNDPSLVTDSRQRITRVISRGLILPGGNIVKARVSIQRASRPVIS